VVWVVGVMVPGARGLVSRQLYAQYRECKQRDSVFVL
jgi:hypothetical protein